MKSQNVLPEQPKTLYTFNQLNRGFELDDPQSFVLTKDFKTFRQFVKEGKDAPVTLRARRRQGEHDAYISNALRRYLTAKSRLVGIMGGHSLKRSDAAYRTIAELSREITRNKFLVITGGGPGAMEAAHLGATFSNSDDEAFQAALTEISTVPALPNLKDLVKPDGRLAPNRESDIACAHEWVCVALKAKSLAASPRGESLAIPTYLYGDEPTTPFATRYAKYFQNSIREEALVTEGRTGVLYAKGGGGTLREIFEDLEQNYYAETSAKFTPMIFADPDGYWAKDAEIDGFGNVSQPGIKMDVTIRSIVRFARVRSKDADQCQEKILFTTDAGPILKILNAQSPVAEASMKLLLLGMTPRQRGR